MFLSAMCALQCGSNPTGPSTITLACPAAQSVASVSGLPIAVTFALPTASGGTAPITTTCTPPSGANFPIGSTTVTCTAADAKQQTASCSFSVAVTAPPRVSVTRYVAFGDSITEGLPRTFGPTLLDPPPPGSYPAQLYALLTARYTAQVESIVVFDEGVGGELIANGLARLTDVLNTHNAGALLLMEGANDLNSFGASGIVPSVSGLRQMIRNATGRSMQVFVGTLLPMRAGLPRTGGADFVVPANEAIRAVAREEGAILVDLYQAFGGTADPSLISSDGLHPTAKGNELIAQTFFDAIRMRLETTGLTRSW